MLFRGSHNDGHRRKRGGVLGFFRLLLSLFVMAMLFLAVYAAYRSFSPEFTGTNQFTSLKTIKDNPKEYLKSLLTSDGLYEFVTTLLSFNPQVSLDKGRELVLNRSDKNSPSIPTNSNSDLAFRFAIVTDSHNDTNNLKKSLSQSKEAGAKFIIGLGDYSDVGTIDELNIAKNEFNNIGLPLYSIAGDHDLWDSRNKKQDPAQNYTQVFGPTYQSFEYLNTRLILLYNSDNYIGIDDLQKKWLEDELERTKSTGQAKNILIFTSTPLYHPTSDHVMGKVNKKLKSQAEYLESLFQSHQVSEIFAGDAHQYSRYNSPKGLKMTTIGAVTSSRNLQAPRFALVDIFEDGSYNVQDMEIK